MELKPGYKQTEVGLIPEGWEVKALGDIFGFSGGFTASRDQLSNEGYCYLHYGDIHKSSKAFVDVQAEYLDIPKLNVSLKRVSSRSLLKDGDVVFVDASEDDEGTSKHIVVHNEADIPYISGLHTIVAKSKTTAFDNRYKQFCFHTADIKRQFYFYAAGTKVSGISKTNIAKLFIPLPSPPEQCAIAAPLSDVDGLIFSLEKLIAKKRDLKQAAMQQLLTGQTRLPGFHGKWEVMRLGEVSAIKTGKKNSEDKVEDGRYPFFVRSQSVERINSYSFEGEAILVPGEGGIGSIFHYVNGRFDYHQRVYKISDFTAEICSKFLFFCMVQTFNKQATRNSVKATVDSLRLPTFLEFEILAPSVDEQRAIAAVLSDMDAELAVLEGRLEKTRALKQGMMQELLTGRTRLV